MQQQLVEYSTENRGFGRQCTLKPKYRLIHLGFGSERVAISVSVRYEEQAT